MIGSCLCDGDEYFFYYVVLNTGTENININISLCNLLT